MNDDPATHAPNGGDEKNSAFFWLVGWGALIVLWVLWWVSLPAVGTLLLAFDSEVSVTEGILWGSIQATWVAGIPVALLVGRHVVGHGWEMPRWRLRWLIVALCALAWIAIVSLWIILATVG